jgi:hypothetical protein
MVVNTLIEKTVIRRMRIDRLILKFQNILMGNTTRTMSPITSAKHQAFQLNFFASDRQRLTEDLQDCNLGSEIA